MKPERELRVSTHGFLSDEETIIDEILKQRGIIDKDEFLYPDEKYLLADETIENFQDGLNLMSLKLKEDTLFYLSVDCDVDGVTSGAIMYRWLMQRDRNAKYYVSKGKEHGISQGLIDDLKDQLAALKDNQNLFLIVMDSLDSDCSSYQSIHELGVDILILDHHEIREEIPYQDYVTLVSSNHSQNHYLSGAGVVWKFCRALDDLLYWDDFTFRELSDLAAVGLIADMMDVSQSSMETRFIVDQGLRSIKNPAIKKIIGNYDFNSTAIAFSISPLINAACRYFENDTAFLTFISDDEKIIKRCIRTMKHCKERQKDDYEAIRDSLEELIDEQKDHPYLFLPIETEYGIAGYIANQILSTYQKPVFVVLEDELTYHGSARSTPAFDLREITHEIVPSATGFGHNQAFGFSINKDEIFEFDEKLCQALGQAPIVVEEIDCLLDVEDITPCLINYSKEIGRISGQGFKPLKYMVETSPVKIRTMSDGKHLVFEGEEGMLFIQWNSGDQIDQFKNLHSPMRFIGTLDCGYFGRTWNRRMIIDSVEVL